VRQKKIRLTINRLKSDMTQHANDWLHQTRRTLAAKISLVAGNARLRGHDDAAPKRHATLYALSRLFCFRVVPGGVLVHFSVDDDMVLACLTLPRTDCVLTAGLEIFLI
jgi:hypothetical protein